MTAERPRVDVGVVTWNTRDLTVTALRRLLDDDQGVDVRLFVRDNGSTDGTPDAVRSDVPEAVVDADTDNLGFGRGMNRLITVSDAPWFFALNSDAWPERGAIGTLVAAAEAHPRAAAVAPRLERPDGTLEHSTHPFPSMSVALRSGLPGWARHHPEKARALFLHGAWAHDVATDVDWAVGAALLMRRDALDELGGFDERLFMYAEDLDWCWRARNRGWSIRFEPAAVVRHVGNASGAQNYKATRSAAYWRNTYRVYSWSHGPVSTAALRVTNASAAALAALRSRHDPGVRAHFRREARAHFGSIRSPDGPPS